MQNAIRLADDTDREAIEEIVDQAYRPWVAVIGSRPAPMDADYASLIAAERVYVIGTGDLDGLIVLIPENDALLIDNVAVRPGEQRRGVGRQLLAFAESTAQQLGLPAVRLFTHERMSSNIQLYEALGYSITARQAIEYGHIVHMRKNLGFAGE